MIFQRLIWAALAVALVAGSVQTGVQQVTAVPLILAAEAYEGQQRPVTELVAQPLAAPTHEAPAEQHTHSHGAQSAPVAARDSAPDWAPAHGLERTGWTWVANVLYAFSMALLVLSVMGVSLWRGTSLASLPLGLLVAGAGWLSLHLWPSLGLPAEIPGMDAARLGSRQGWWGLAAVSASLACLSLAWLKTPLRWAAPLMWLALPFAVGAPHITADPLAGFGLEAQAALRQLGHDFIGVTHAVAVLFWLSMGVLCGLVFQRWLRPVLLAALNPPAAANPVLKENT